MTIPQGIAGMVGRESFGAVLVVGIKGENGAPTEKDRFTIVWPVARDATFKATSGKTWKGEIRDPHPSFRAFNTAAQARRVEVKAQLVHGTQAECFQHSYRCQKVDGRPGHPAKIPYCMGNGVTASRYIPGDKRADERGYVTIPCPGEKCEFRSTARGKAPCGPGMRLAFRLLWTNDAHGMPTLLTKYTSGAWNTTKNCLGMFEHIARAASAVGLPDYSLAGLRFTMQLTEKSSAAAKTRFPVVQFVLEDDPVAFFAAQMERRRQIAELAPIESLRRLDGPVPMALADDDDDADFAAVRPGSMTVLEGEIE